MMKWLRRLLLYPLLVLILLPVGVVAYVMGTESGLQKTLDLAQKNVPGVLNWEKASGRFFGPLDLAGVQFEQKDGVKLALDRAHWQWTPSALMGGKLKINALELNGLDVYLPPPGPQTDIEEDKQPLQLPQIDLPLSIVLDQIDLQDINIYPHGSETPINIERVQLTAAGEENQFRLVDLRIDAPEVEATLRGYIQPQGEYPLDLTLLWSAEHGEFGAFKGEGSVQGTLQNLEVEHNLNGLLNAKLKANVEDALNSPKWNARLQADSRDLGALSPALEQAPLAAELTSAGTLDAFKFAATADTTLSASGPLSLNVDGKGNTQLITLQPLLVSLKQNGGQLEVAGDVKLDTLQADLKGQWTKLAWPIVSDNPDYVSPTGDFEFKGGVESFEISLKSELDGAVLQPLTLNLSASGNPEKIDLSGLQLKASESPTSLVAKGDIDIKQQRFDLSGDWNDLAWPMRGDAQYASAQGQFTAKGTFEDYEFSADTEVGGISIPKGKWTLNGEGNSTGLNHFDLDGHTLGGKLSVSGKTAWKPQVSWQVDAQGQQLNPGEHWEQLPGSLNVTLTSDGAVGPDGPQLKAVISRLDGHFKDKPVKGRGEVRVAGQEITVDRLELESLESTLAANGSLSDLWDLDFTLSSPDLGKWSPAMGGSVDAQGSLGGSRNQPSAKVKFGGKDIKQGLNEIKRVSGILDLDLSGTKLSSINVGAETLLLSGQTWESFTLEGDGRPNTHNLNLALKGDEAQIDSRLRGGMQGSNWQGTLEKLDILKTALGDWVLADAADISANADRASAEAICLTSAPSKVCLQGRWDKSKGSDGLLSIEQFNTARLSEILPEEVGLDTRLDVEAKGAVSPRGRVKAQASVDLSPGKLVLHNDTQPSEIALGATRITALVDGKNLSSNLDVDLGKLGNLTGDVGMKGFDSSGRLSGNIKPRFTDLSVVSLLAPQLQTVKGRFIGDVKLGGTIASPQITGALDLEQFAAEIPAVSMQLEKTELHIAGSGGSPLKIVGEAHSGGGQLNISGALNPQTRVFDLSLNGENFVIADSQQLRASITPDLRLAMNDEGMSVSGKLGVPHAFVDANGGNAGIETVDGSSDVVILDTNGQRPADSKASNLTMDVRVELGDDIKVEAGEFSGQLKGNLRVEQTPQLAPRGTGTIEIVSGDYVVYGQQLNIQRGRVLFSGGPVDNPQLDMDVARRVEAYDVLAGAKIRGTAQSPLLQLYSEPSMPDASILSYILLGQPPGTKGGSYTLGKFITPDLYVSYGIGLFNAINTFNMRYRLTEKLSLQAASGLTNSADLIYNFER